MLRSRRGAELAYDYLARNTGDPMQVAEVVNTIVHTQVPDARYVIGASFEMQYIVPYIPQFLLDAATRVKLRS